MNDEILAGMKNAVAKGSSVEQAAQSFINAGYNPSEVSEMASLLSSNSSQVQFKKLPEPVQVTEQSGAPSSPESSGAEKPKQASKTMIIVLIIVALIIVGAAMGLLLFKEQFLSLIDAIFP